MRVQIFENEFARNSEKHRAGVGARSNDADKS